MNELQLQTGAYRTTYKGTEILRQSTKQEWENYGTILKCVDEAKQWAIGDWLVDGKSHYGDGLYEQAAEIVELEYGYLRDLKYVSEMFELSARADKLSFRHHREVASIKSIEIVPDKKLKQGRMQWSKEPDKEKMQEFLELADDNELSVRELKEQVDRYRQDKEREFSLHNSPEMFDVFYADPPWKYNDELIEEYGAATHHYRTMTIPELCALPVKAITADNAVLFIWVTSPLLEECFDVIKAWGFKYKTSFIWDKQDHNYGHYNSVRHELLLICTKGSYLPQSKKLTDSVQSIKRTNEHSEKPNEFRSLIEEMYPSGRKKELFARVKYSGWDGFGDEI